MSSNQIHKPDPDAPTALIYEPNPNICEFLRDYLSRMGFQFIDAVRELSRETDIASSKLHDLLVIDVSLNPEGFAKKIQEIRRFDPLGNPFSIFVMTGKSLTQQQGQAFVSSGCDAFIVKPFQSEEALEKISQVLDADRKFVVSPHYVGPDRRTFLRSGSADTVFLPIPNRAKLKLGQDWQADFHAEQEATLRLVLRTVHLAESVLWLCRILDGQLIAQPMSQRRIQSEILRSTELVHRELQRDRPETEVTALCHGILDLVARMRVEDVGYMQVLSNKVRSIRNTLIETAGKQAGNPDPSASRYGATMQNLRETAYVNI